MKKCIISESKYVNGKVNLKILLDANSSTSVDLEKEDLKLLAIDIDRYLTPLKCRDCKYMSRHKFSGCMRGDGEQYCYKTIKNSGR